MRTSTAVVVVGALLALTACETSQRIRSDTPRLSRVGEYVVTYEDSELDLALGYRFAAQNLGDDWMLLEMAVSGQDRRRTELTRDGIALIAPDGQRLELASHEEFASAYRTDLAPVVRRASIGSDPLDYFRGDRVPCNQWFFALPTQGLAYDKVFVNDRQICQGYLFFDVPAGVRSGEWTLVIEEPEGEALIPFRL